MIREPEIAEALGTYVHGCMHDPVPVSGALHDAGLDPNDALRAAYDYAGHAFPGDPEMALVYASGVLAGLVAGRRVRDAENASCGAERGG